MVALFVAGERLNYNICSWREYLQIFKEPSKCIQAITVNGSFHPSVTSDYNIHSVSLVYKASNGLISVRSPHHIHPADTKR